MKYTTLQSTYIEDGTLYYTFFPIILTEQFYRVLDKNDDYVLKIIEITSFVEKDIPKPCPDFNHLMYVPLHDTTKLICSICSGVANYPQV